MSQENYNVLIVDDSEDERFLLRRCVQRIPNCRVVGTLPDGQTTMDYLSGTEAYHDRQLFPFPSVLLLDFAMPRMNGLQVLTWLKAQKFADLFTIMISHSFKESDIESSLRMGANHCMEKADQVNDAAFIEGCLQNLMPPQRTIERQRPET